MIVGLVVCCESCDVWWCYGGGLVGLVWVFGVVSGIFLCEWWWVLVVFFFIFFLSDVGGCGFVLVVVVGVVAAVVVVPLLLLMTMRMIGSN